MSNSEHPEQIAVNNLAMSHNFSVTWGQFTLVSVGDEAATC